MKAQLSTSPQMCAPMMRQISALSSQAPLVSRRRSKNFERALNNLQLSYDGPSQTPFQRSSKRCRHSLDVRRGQGKRHELDPSEPTHRTYWTHNLIGFTRNVCLTYIPPQRLEYIYTEWTPRSVTTSTPPRHRNKEHCK